MLHWGPTQVYRDLLRLVSELGVPYAIMTSNTDELFAQSGFDPERVFTPQGGSARLQCAAACHPDAHMDARPWVARAVPHLDLADPRVPAGMADLIPRCERCGGAVCFNVRRGASFLETPHRAAAARHAAAVERMLQRAAQGDGNGEGDGDGDGGGRVVVLELGSGFNTPSVVRYPSEALGGRAGATLLRVNKEHPEAHSAVAGARAYKMGAAEFLRACLAHRRTGTGTPQP